MELYRSTLDVDRARSAFEASPYIRSLWPAELIERTRPYFAIQALLNTVYWEGARPIARIADLDRVLSSTTLRTLPLWMLGTDEIKQQIAETAGRTEDGTSEYAHALRALSGRDFESAARLFDAARRRGLNAPTIRPLQAYALAKNGDLRGAEAIAADVQPGTVDERRFWDWLTARLEPSGTEP
jgi:hypothetical protein